jgi:hypothetical protein
MSGSPPGRVRINFLSDCVGEASALSVWADAGDTTVGDSLFADQGKLDLLRSRTRDEPSNASVTPADAYRAESVEPPIQPPVIRVAVCLREHVMNLGAFVRAEIGAGSYGDLGAVRRAHSPRPDEPSGYPIDLGNEVVQPSVVASVGDHHRAKSGRAPAEHFRDRTPSRRDLPKFEVRVSNSVARHLEVAGKFRRS